MSSPLPRRVPERAAGPTASTSLSAGHPMTDSPRSPGRILLGDEAVALGALDAGISAAYAYPGTPSTEIFEFIEAEVEGEGRPVTAHWTANEKTAYEAALGVSLVGRRVLVSMKHVGLNVAADPFINSALVDIRGGLVLAVADDPSMHSSQNEQDSRFMADFARVACLEPATQQEAYEMTREAFDLSERFHIPVMIRMVTRLCHGRARVRPSPRTEPNPLHMDAEPRNWTLLPANARRLWRELVEVQEELRLHTERTGWTTLDLGDAGAPDASDAPDPSGGPDASSGPESPKNPTRPEGPESPERPRDMDGWPADESARPPFAVITAGLARTHFEENVADLDFRPPHLHVGAYPLPAGKLEDVAGLADRVLVLEEGYPFVERQLRGLIPSEREIMGRESGALPRTGELTPDSVRDAMGLEPRPRLEVLDLELPGRPPQLCRGCAHRNTFSALRGALEDVEQWLVAGDVGCYTLGALPPYEALHSCVCMGASIGMAKGAADAGLRPVVAVIGDSTFLHSGITPLMDAAAHDTDMTVLILDNRTVAMTGQQTNALPRSELWPIVEGLGIDAEHVHLVDVDPRGVRELAGLMRREMDHRGLSVIIGVRECIQSVRKRRKRERAGVMAGAATAASAPAASAEGSS